MSAKLTCIGDLDYFKQSIFDYGISKPCGDVGNLCAFLLRLLYLRVHKHGTACSQINRMLGKKSSLCKILYTVIQRFCKGLNKGTAAGGTCLVELNGIHRLIFDFNTFHILTADVDNAVDIRVKKGGSIVVCHGFHFAFIQHKCSLKQCFSIAG